VQEYRDVKWILVISLILLWISWPISSFGFLFFGAISSLPVYHLPPRYTPIELAWYGINRADVLTFMLTVTFAALFTTDFGKKELWYKLSIYLFITSMALFFIVFLQTLIGLPYR